MIKIYDFAAKTIEGRPISLKDFSEKVLIIVNVASKCGYTEKNYKELQELYEKYSSKGLEIFAFPCNDFLNQESGNEKEICEFASKRKITFHLMNKVSVNGSNADPIFQYLKNASKGILGTSSIKWNFTKFLCFPDGTVKRFGPSDSPMSMENDIKNLLK